MNRILDDAMLSNPNLLMLIVDPLPNEKISNRIKTYNVVGERAFLFTLTEEERKLRATLDQPSAFLDEFASEILPNVKWLDEWFRLRKLEKSIERSDFPSYGVHEEKDAD